MPASSAAMELKVLISVLQSGQVLPNLLNQVNQLTQGLTKLQQQTSKTPTGSLIPPIPPTPKINEATHALMDLDGAANKLISSLKFLVGGFLALESVRFLKDLADTAARAQVLQTVLHVVGNNAGFATEELDKTDKAVQRLGITATASRQAITQAVQAGLPLSDIPKLARAAQDTAVILGTDSSEAFQRLVTAIQTSNTLMLRHMGIIVQSQTAYDRFAQSIGKTASQLTTYERMLAFSNATLEEAAKLEGTYTAAMGDVGKQLTSLTRFTENLKEGLGKGLLPAYSAIVEELTDFLRYLGLVSEEMGGQTKAARELGDAVRSVAHALSEVGKTLIEHRNLVAFVVEAYLTFRLLRPVIGVIAGLGTQLTGLAAGAGMAGFLAFVGGVPGLIALAVAALVALALTFPRVRAALEGVTYVIGGFVLVLFSMGKAIVQFVELLGKALYQIAHPWEADWSKIEAEWTKWKNLVKTSVDEAVSYANAAKAAFSDALSPEGSLPSEQRESEVRKNRIAETRQTLAGLQLDETAAKDAIKVARDAQQELALETAERHLKDIKKSIEELEVERSGLLEKEHVPMARENALLEEARAAVILKREMEGVNAARAKSQFVYGREGEISRGFSTAITEYNTLLSAFNKGLKDANVNTQELTSNLQEAGKATRTPADLKAFGTAVREFTQRTDISPSQRATARTALAAAAIQVEEAALAPGASVAARREKQFREMEKRQADHLKAELDLMQTAFQMQEAIDTQKYSRLGMDFDKYWDRREARLKELTDQEILQAKNNLAAAEREKDKKIPRTAAEREELESRRLSAQAALDALQGTGEGAQRVPGSVDARFLELQIQRINAFEDKQKQAKQTLLDIVALHGTEAEALEAVNNKYKEQYDKATTEDEQKAAIAQQREAVFETERKYRELALEMSLRETREEQNQLSLQQARINAERGHIAAREKTGDISVTQAMLQRNALVRRQVAQDEQTIIAKTNELREQRNALDLEEKAVREFMKGESENEIQAKLNADLAQRRQIIQGLTVDIYNLNEGVKDAGAQMENYGKKIQEHLIDGLADALTQSIVDFRKAGDVWINLSKSITNEIVGIFTKAFTQKFFSNNMFSWVDRVMGLGLPRGGGGIAGDIANPSLNKPPGRAEGGPVIGPGTGTSDSIPAMLSAGEHIMPAAKAARFMPLLEGIRLGKILPFATGGVVQSIAIPSIIPHRYAMGGVVTADGGASQVETAAGGGGPMLVQLHPDVMDMTMREWLEREVVRQHGRR